MILSFQSRILLFFSALFIGIQVLTVACVYKVSRDNVIGQLNQSLFYAEQVFNRLLTERGERIAGETRILVADFGFRTTVAGSDAKTIASALENLALRIHGQRAFYVGLEGRVIADTAGRLQGKPFIFPDALMAAESHGKAVVLGLLDGVLYEWAIVPVLAPVPVGWVAVAMAVDRGMVDQFKHLSTLPLEITLAERSQDSTRILASSLPEAQKSALAAGFFGRVRSDWEASEPVELAGQRYIGRVRQLPSAAKQQAIVAALQIDFDRALAPYRPMFYAAAGLLVLGLFATLLGSVLIARNLSRPVRALAGASESIMNGTLSAPIPVTRQDELGRLADTFNRAARLAEQLGELQQKDQLRREMVATVSHDLRTPLTSLYGFLETMQLKTDSLPPMEQQRFLEVALRQTEKVSRLAQELFELAKLECDETSLNQEAFCLAELLQDVVQKFQLEARRRGVELTAGLCRDLPPVFGDIGLIERLLTNLLDNALRHTPKDGQIGIDAWLEDRRIRIGVSDTGSGIAPEYLPTLFDWDSPLSRRARADAGGFGLMVVAKIARLHGSDIQVDSKLGQGTTFRFDLPLARLP